MLFPKRTVTEYIFKTKLLLYLRPNTGFKEWANSICTNRDSNT